MSASEPARSEPAAPAVFDLPQSLQTLALAYSVVDLANDMPGESWWRLVEHLHDIAAAALAAPVHWPGDPYDVMRSQLLAGELPIVLGNLLPEVRAFAELRQSAHAMLTESLLELNDGCGLPHARLLPVMMPLFACWTRARWLGERLKHGGWSREAENQFHWLVQHALRLVDSRGRLMLLEHEKQPSSSSLHELFATALRLAGDRNSCSAAAAVLGKANVPRRFHTGKRDLPEASLESDWSGLVVMASGWSPSQTRLALAFADDPVRIELEIGGDKLLVGDLSSETTCDGVPVHVVGEWEESAWETGRRFDYVELAVELTGGLRLERQLLFARDDRILFLADSVFSPDGAPRPWRHSLRLPLAPGAAWRPESETRDGVIVAGKRRAAVLPLALHEWRSDPRGGQLAQDGSTLVLTQEHVGQSLYCPLVVDLKSRRSDEERTWRQLTVVELMQVVPRDIAVGFRAQSGRDQWVFYRSLGPTGNRTLLGYNIAGEFAAGRFLASGKVKEWLEVEAV